MTQMNLLMFDLKNFFSDFLSRWFCFFSDFVWDSLWLLLGFWSVGGRKHEKKRKGEASREGRREREKKRKRRKEGARARTCSRCCDEFYLLSSSGSRSAATVMDARAVPTWLHAQIEYLRNNAPLPLKVRCRHLFLSSASFYIALIGCCLWNFKARWVRVRMQHCSSWQRSPMCQLSARHVLLLCPRDLDSFRVRVTAINCRVRLWVGSVTFVVFLFFLVFPVFLEGRSPVISVAMNTDTSFQRP